MRLWVFHSLKQEKAHGYILEKAHYIVVTSNSLFYPVILPLLLFNSINFIFRIIHIPPFEVRRLIFPETMTQLSG